MSADHAAPPRPGRRHGGVLDAPARAATAFRSLAGHEPRGVWSAPGRVNLIGDHTDYNDGLVLPFALPHRTAVAAAPRDDGMLSVTTVGDDGRPQQAAPVALADLAPGDVTGWVAYPYGAAWALRDLAGLRSGAELVIVGDVPAGAGLSSSAALECAVALALTELDLAPGDTPPVDRQLLARWMQHAENNFVGAPTGVLDQTASLCCTAGNVLYFDVRSGHVEQVPFDADASALRVVVIDTRASHAIAESAYGDRRRGCEEAAETLGVATLRDVQDRPAPEVLAELPDRLRPLTRHVLTENGRVGEVVQALRAGDTAEIGELLTASHASLRDDFRVSAPELDVAVDAALAAGALGARMTGGGFGGSAIALVPESRETAVGRAVRTAFDEHGFRPPRVFSSVPSAGAGRDGVLVTGS